MQINNYNYLLIPLLPLEIINFTSQYMLQNIQRRTYTSHVLPLEPSADNLSLANLLPAICHLTALEPHWNLIGS